jgi:methyl-accepting chemotaxis protein
VLAAWSITRLIVVPLKEVLQSVERVANGNLSQDIQVSRRDELGELQPACSA